MLRINHLILPAIAAMLVSCSSPQQQQTPPSSAPPSSAPPSSAPPSPAPPSSTPPNPAPETSSTSPSESSSPPASPGQSESSSPSSPPAGVPGPTASTPGTTGSGSPGSKSADRNPAGESGSEAERREAAENLKKAGQQISDAAQNGAPDNQAGESGSNLPDDPLIPNSDQDSDVYSEGTVSASSMPTMPAPGEPGADGSMTDSESSSESDMSGAEMMGDDPQSAGTGGQGGMTPEQQAAVEAAQEALEQAGIALQTAGVTLEGASTDGELAAAEADLSKARLSVIIAGQDLQDLRKIFEGTVNEDIFADAEETLNEANGAIVVATESIFSTRIELPEFATPPGGVEAGGAPGSGGLDDELNESIAIFEGKIIEARNVIIDGTPAPTGSDNVPGVLVLGGGSGTDRETTLKENDGTQGDLNIPEVLEPGMMPNEGREVASSSLPATPNPIPDDIPDAQGDDIVAKQLREAAISETDPKLSAKLWDEYRKYKAGL